MKMNTYLKLIAATLFSLAIVYLFNSCKENVSDPCAEEFEITVVATGCVDGEENQALAGAKMVVWRFNGQELVEESGDTLVMDQTGSAVYKPQKPFCNINLQFEVISDEFAFRSDVFHACKDTTFNIDFDCPPEKDFDCDNLEGERTLVFEDNEGNSCLLINSPGNGDYYEECLTIRNTSPYRIRIDNINALINYNLDFSAGKFKFASLTPARVPGQDYYIASGKTATICFNVLTDELGEYTGQFILDLVCVNNSGVDQNSGQYTINLEAEVCDIVCECPEDKKDRTKSFELTPALNLSEGQTTGSLTNLLALKNVNDEDGCVYEVTSIQRYSDGSAYGNGYTVPDPTNREEWQIVAPAANSLPVVLGAGDEFRVSADLNTNDRLGALADTFQINVTITNQASGASEPCNYFLILESEACRSICPKIRITGPSITVMKDGINPTNYADYDEYWKESDTIKINLNATMPPTEPNCTLSELVSKNNRSFDIYYPENEYACSNEESDISVQTQGQDIAARNLFSFSGSSNYSMETGEDASLKVTFSAPNKTLFEQYRPQASNPNATAEDSTFRYYVTLVRYQPSYCKQVIEVSAVVTPAPELSPPRQIDAYNQSTEFPKKPVPDFLYAKINERHGDGSWGVVYSTLDPITGDPRSFDEPRIQGGTFFINVDYPKDSTNASNSHPQHPELHLVDPAINSFDYIALYRNMSEKEFESGNWLAQFKNDYPNCSFFSNQGNRIQPVYNGNNYNNTTPYAQSYEDITGVPLAVGQVYIVFDDNFSANSGCPCRVAAIFIREVTDGNLANPNSSNNLANILFRIMYPIVF